MNYETLIRKEESKEVKKEVYFFKKVLEDNFNSNLLNNFYHNGKTVQIIKNIFIEGYMGAMGTYNNEENIIFYTEEHVKTHELFHMSSTYFKNPSYLQSGFFYVKNYDEIGYAINECMTDLIDERLFKKEVYIKSFYDKFKYLFNYLYNIIGYNKLEELYLTNNFKGLIDILRSLKGIDTEYNAIMLIKEFDTIMSLEEENDDKVIIKKDNLEKELIKIKKLN